MVYLYVLMPFVPSLLQEMHRLDPVTTGWVMSGGGALICLLQIIAPTVSDRIGRKPLLMILFAAGTVGGILFALAPVGSSPGLLALYFTLFCVGIGGWPLAMIIVPTETVPFTLAATAVAIPQGVGEIIGATVFPAIGGRIADVYGLSFTMWMVVVASAVALLTVLFARETAPRVAMAQKELAA
jgi:MFS family permease